MILIQIILILSFLSLLIKFIANPNSHQIKAWKKIFGISLVVIAIAAVVFPEMLNNVAQFFGVGRGADLVLYLLTLAFIFTAFAQYSNSKHEQQRYVSLARKIALVDADNKRNRELW